MKVLKSAVNLVPYGTCMHAVVTFKLFERKDGFYNIHNSEQGRCMGKNVPDIILMSEGKSISVRYIPEKKGYIITQ